MSRKFAINHVSVTDQVADYILMEVATGKWGPGDKVPEREICDSLNVSRVPVREAMRLLQAQGVLHAKPNRGVFVNASSVEDTMEMLEVRETIEAIAIRRILADKTRLQDTREALNGCVRELEKCALVQDVMEFCRADLMFHQTIVELSGSSVLRSLWESISRNVFIFLVNERGGVFDYQESIEDHCRLIHTIFDDTTRLDAELHTHIVGYVLANHPEIKDRKKP